MNRVIMKNVVVSLGVILMILLPMSTSALTTFGKTNPQNQNPPPPPAPADDLLLNISAFGRLTSMGRSGGRPGMKTGYLGHSFGVAKTCKSESDCIGIGNTSCVADPKDGKTKCLCSDLTAPYNGACLHKPVHSPCKDNQECGPGAHCTLGNSTTHVKTCQCQYGYYEENMRCNGCLSSLQSSSVLVLLFSLILLRNMSSS
ncbi:uncharacterized protein sosie isoform X1 [Fopius arisanus]|uniref:Uncharacterized protein sosie isoform X1 n=1 Tax=Fopius arisanus TaxID=64838 RepID=A0A9R1SX79_9HYME|nr:PREDICTED: uncharacterized protein LOC105263941 isoform X1 [Fopius arisanus]